MSIGEYLKKLRQERNLSAREAAKRIGISYTRLQELEMGISRTTGKATSPTTDLLIKIARGYDQPLSLLLEMAGLAPVSPDQEQEAELIQIFRTLSDQGRDLSIALIRSVKDQEQKRE